MKAEESSSQHSGAEKEGMAEAGGDASIGEDMVAEEVVEMDDMDGKLQEEESFKPGDEEGKKRTLSQNIYRTIVHKILPNLQQVLTKKVCSKWIFKMATSHTLVLKNYFTISYFIVVDAGGLTWSQVESSSGEKC